MSLQNSFGGTSAENQRGENQRIRWNSLGGTFSSLTFLIKSFKLTLEDIFELVFSLLFEFSISLNLTTGHKKLKVLFDQNG